MSYKFNKDALIQYRKVHNLTQAAAAKKAGIKTTTLGHYETGAVDPPASKLTSIINSLTIPIEDIFVKTDTVSSREKLVEDKINPDTNAEKLSADVQTFYLNTIIRAFNTCKSEKERALFYRIAEAFLWSTYVVGETADGHNSLKP